MGAERPLGLTQGATPTSRLLNSLTQRHAHLTGAADAGHTAALEQLWNLEHVRLKSVRIRHGADNLSTRRN